LLLSSASLRLNETRLPIIKLTAPEFINSLLGGRYTHGGLQVLCTIEGTTAKLLATPIRDVGVAGPDLRGAHRRVGWYLAIEFLADVIGLELSLIRHVLGYKTRGY